MIGHSRSQRTWRSRLKVIAMLALLLSGTIAASAQCTAGFSAVPGLPGTVNFTSTSTGTTAYTNYFWNFGDGNYAYTQNPSHSYSSGNYYSSTQSWQYVCLTIWDSLNNCQSTICDTVVYNNFVSSCNASFTSTTDSLGQPIVFTNTSSGTTAGTSYLWSFGDGGYSTSANPTHTYTSAQGGWYYGPGIIAFNVCLTLQDSAASCSSTFCDTVFVYAQTAGCNASFTYVDSLNSPFVSFTNTSSGFPNYYYWDFGDGNYSYSQNPAHNYSASGTYIVCLTISNNNTSCSDTYCDTVVVSFPPYCNAYFYSANDTAGNGVSFYNQSSSTQGITWLWDFGDGNNSQAQDPYHVYASSGIYTVCLTMTDNATQCTDTYCNTVYIGCNAQFYSYPDSMLMDGTVYFIDYSSNNNTILSWFWDFGDGNTSTLQNPVHQYASSGNYWVCLTISNSSQSCSSQFCDSISALRTTGIEETAAVHNVSMYPNPFNNSTTISYTLGEKGNIEVAVFDMLGNKLVVLAAGEQAAGAHQVDLSAEHLSSGIYMLKVMSAKGSTTKLLIKN